MLWYIAVGGALGSVARFVLGGAVQRSFGASFPLGTLVINVTGSLLIGFLFRYALETPAVSAEMRAMLTTGFCGGFTTFSTFSYESVGLLEEGEYMQAVSYVALSVLLSLGATVIGFALARELLVLRRGA